MKVKMQEIKELSRVDKGYNKEIIKYFFPKANILNNQEEYLEVANRCLEDLSIEDNPDVNVMNVARFSVVISSINLYDEIDKQWFGLFFR